jgi:hypothetical protein
MRDPVEQLRRKMQSGRGRSHTAPVRSKHGLITIPVRLVVVASNVGRERNMPMLFYERPGITLSFKADDPPAARCRVFYHGPEIRREFNSPAGFELPAGSYQSFESGA